LLKLAAKEKTELLIKWLTEGYIYIGDKEKIFKLTKESRYEIIRHIFRSIAFTAE
jgi:hypothetical protein